MENASMTGSNYIRIGGLLPEDIKIGSIIRSIDMGYTAIVTGFDVNPNNGTPIAAIVRWLGVPYGLETPEDYIWLQDAGGYGNHFLVSWQSNWLITGMRLLKGGIDDS